MNTKFRPALLALAFSATVAAAITGYTFRGETKEAATLAETCSQYAWPNIPANCLDGEHAHQVRTISTDVNLDGARMALRFGDAFDSRS